MTTKQSLFCKEYIIDFNATRAAKAAGYSERTAYAIGAKLLKNVEIQSKILSEIKARENRTEITADRVLREIALLAFSDIKDFVTIGDDGQIAVKKPEEIGENLTRCIESVQEDRAISESASGEGDRITVFDKVKYKLHSKPRALEMLARHLGLYAEDRIKLGFDTDDADEVKVKMTVVHTRDDEDDDDSEAD